MHKFIIYLYILLFPLNIYSFSLDLWSESAILIDFQTEQILYEKNKNLVIQPASMTKMLTIYMAYESINNGYCSKDSLVEITKNADYKSLPRDSSLMFIEENQTVTLLELMTGLAIPSGNDAAIAIAEYLYGSIDNYLAELNKTVKKLGLDELNFVDSSGYSDNNYITVAQFAEFCIIFLKKYPEALDELFTLESFTYPKKINGSSSIGGIKQYNHNPLIGIYPQCDGLKTGFINISGMNISLTATKDDRRVVAVLAGVKDKNKNIAEQKRVYDAITILNYGLHNHINTNLSEIVLPNITIYLDNEYVITPQIPYNRPFTYNINTKTEYIKLDNTLPIEFGEHIGYIRLISEAGISYEFPIISNRNIYLNH